VLETVTKEKEKNWKRLGCVQSTLARPGTPDCPMMHRTVSRAPRLDLGELDALGFRRRRTTKIHRTVWWCTGPSGESSAMNSSLSRNGKRWRGYNSPDCPVVHRTVRWANGRQRQWSATKSTGDAWQLQRSAGGTRQCPVHQRTRSCNGRQCPIWKEITHRTGYSSCPVAHRTVWCATRQKAGIAFQDCLQRLLAALGL
jgi:hypothetical protein